MADHGTTARPYAQAVFEIARTDNQLGDWSQFLALAAGIASSPDAAAVLRFYAAGNEALAGMGPEALAASVAEDARIGSPGDPESDYAAFAADLAAVGRGTPGLRFRVDSVIGAGGQAVARVSLGGGAPA